jgi:uncharacterized membrane-anchored protein YhcB (DUF1043 family)
VKGDSLWLLIFVVGIAGVLVGFLLNTNASEVARARAETQAARNQVKAAHDLLDTNRTQYNDLFKKHKMLENVLAETSSFYPSLAEAIADFRTLQLESTAGYLQVKPRPALKASDEVREAARAKREAERRFKILQYQLSYYENAFPWLVDYSGRSSHDLLADLERRSASEISDPENGGDDPIRR